MRLLKGSLSSRVLWLLLRWKQDSDDLTTTTKFDEPDTAQTVSLSTDCDSSVAHTWNVNTSLLANDETAHTVPLWPLRLFSFFSQVACWPSGRTFNYCISAEEGIIIILLLWLFFLRLDSADLQLHRLIYQLTWADVLSFRWHVMNHEAPKSDCHRPHAGNFYACASKNQFIVMHSTRAVPSDMCFKTFLESLSCKGLWIKMVSRVSTPRPRSISARW